MCIFAQKLVLILWVKCFADDHGTMQVTKYYLLIQVQTCLVVCVEQPWFHQTRCGVCHQPPSPEYGCLPGSQQAPDTDMQSECCFYLLPQHVSSNILAHLPSPVFHHWVYQRKKKKNNIQAPAFPALLIHIRCMQVHKCLKHVFKNV